MLNAHTASDLGVTFTVALSLVALQYDVPFVDPILSVLIALYIAVIAWRILAKNAFVLTDSAPLAPAVVEAAVLGVDGVISCHKVRTRGWEGNIFVDLHVQVDPTLSTSVSHQITHDVEDRIMDTIDGVRDVVIHTEPYEEPEEDTP